MTLDDRYLGLLLCCLSVVMAGCATEKPALPPEQSAARIDRIAPQPDTLPAGTAPSDYPHPFWDLACVHVYYMPKDLLELVDMLTFDRDCDPARICGTVNFIQPDEKGRILTFMLMGDHLKIRKQDQAFSEDYRRTLRHGSVSYANYANNLGTLAYCDGDFTQARILFTESAPLNPCAHIMLGLMDENGQGGLQDYSEAMRHFEIAGMSGNPVTDNYLGVALLNGIVVEKDQVRGRMLIERAAAKTYPIAQVNLGILFLLGVGGARSLVQAHKWINLAANTELGAPKTILAYLTKNMSPDQLRQAQAMAKEFQAGLVSVMPPTRETKN